MVGHVDQNELTRAGSGAGAGAGAGANGAGTGVEFALATPTDDVEIRRLLRENPMPGRISISLEREPDASLAAAFEGDVHHTIVARDFSSGRLIAMGSVAVREMYINGRPMRVGYLGQLRLDRPHRPRASLIVSGYRFFRRALHEALGVPFYLTSIARDNEPARRLLERGGLPGMPTYRPLGGFVTNLIESSGAPNKLPPGLEVRLVYLDHLPEVLECLARNGARNQFAAVWSERELEPRVASEEIQLIVAKRRERVVGCIAVWDQSAYKQAIVRGYDPKLERWRGLINRMSAFTRSPRLPEPGKTLNLAYLTLLAVDDDDPQVFAALLRAAVNPGDAWYDDGGRGYFALGLAEGNALLSAVPKRLRRQTYHTNLYAVHWDDGRDAVEALDGRPCQPEVALL
jgi:hypothetical protein